MDLNGNIMAKYICGECKKKIAQHYYMPASESTENRYYCDECIHPQETKDVLVIIIIPM